MAAERTRLKNPAKAETNVERPKYSIEVIEQGKSNRVEFGVNYNHKGVSESTQLIRFMVLKNTSPSTFFHGALPSGFESLPIDQELAAKLGNKGTFHAAALKIIEMARDKIVSVKRENIMELSESKILDLNYIASNLKEILEKSNDPSILLRR